MQFLSARKSAEWRRESGSCAADIRGPSSAGRHLERKQPLTLFARPDQLFSQSSRQRAGEPGDPAVKGQQDQQAKSLRPRPKAWVVSHDAEEDVCHGGRRQEVTRGVSEAAEPRCQDPAEECRPGSLNNIWGAGLCSAGRRSRLGI